MTERTLRRSRLRVEINIVAGNPQSTKQFIKQPDNVMLTSELIVFDYSKNPIMFAIWDNNDPCLCPELKKFKLARGTIVTIKEVFCDNKGSWSAHFRCNDAKKSAGDLRHSLHVTPMTPL